MLKHVAVTLLEYLNGFLRWAVGKSHRLQMMVQWGLPPQPEWFDHYQDQYWQWKARGSAFWMERGVFSRLLIKPLGRVLEICCGDGFNARHFYSNAAREVVAIDFDPTAIRHARKFNGASNVQFLQQDIRSGLPDGPFDNVIWDAAIEHFTAAEVDTTMRLIGERLGAKGILSGYTLAELHDGKKHLDHHEQEFAGVEDVRKLIVPYFQHVRVWETKHPERHNIYFAASQSPFTVIGT